MKNNKWNYPIYKKEVKNTSWEGRTSCKRFAGLHTKTSSPLKYDDLWYDVKLLSMKIPIDDMLKNKKNILTTEESKLAELCLKSA